MTGRSPAGRAFAPSASSQQAVSPVPASIPNAKTLARMGEAAESALLSELGWYDAGRAAWLALQVAELAAMPDSEIDTSDIPEVTDWSGAKRGMFTAQGIEARQGQDRETGLGRNDESPVAESDAPNDPLNPNILRTKAGETNNG